jgi:hypothetical protein
MEAANSLEIKLETRASSVSDRLQRDARVRIWSKPPREARWFTFELSSHRDCRDALDWLDSRMRPPLSARNRVSSTAPCDQNHAGVYLVRTIVRIS